MFKAIFDLKKQIHFLTFESNYCIELLIVDTQTNKFKID